MEDEIKETTNYTWWARIYIAGSVAVARQTCSRVAMSIGLCVTVTKTDYIYTGGQESGVIVELINYPRFPKETYEITAQAMTLASTLMVDLYQGSASVMTPQKTVWMSRRGD